MISTAERPSHIDYPIVTKIVVDAGLSAAVSTELRFTLPTTCVCLLHHLHS
jgi:hypothetical protein